MIVELAQMDLELGEKALNLESALKIVRKSKADLIVFPELFTTGMNLSNLHEHAEKLDGPTVRELTAECGHRMVAGSIVETDGLRIYNTFILVDDTGLIASYRKIHLFDKEKNHFSPGELPVVAQTHFGKIGFATCYDLRFPELFRKYMELGADLVLVCANFPEKRIRHWEILLKARAIENQYYVLGVNRIGKDTLNTYGGRSMAIDPRGNLLTVADEKEEVVRCMVDKKEILSARSDFPVLEDIRL